MPSRFRLLATAAGAALLVLAGAAQGQAAPPQPAAAAPAGYPASCPPLLRQSFDRLQDEKPQSLCQYSGKVLLVVNTASFCGFTRQYEGLEALDRKYRADGLVVLGFPSNDFAQETGSNKEVADFCENTFGVKFPMFVKSAVRGNDANPLFKELARQTGTTPKWNFYKYLVGRDGKVVAAYSSLTEPDDRKLLGALQKELAQHAN
ncbi:MAG: glutathione peroxidase [Proteobacteria bacterium]|nr:glutathione peroxidase [Pseudomonadota bacterium]